MLTEICAYLCNYFPTDKRFGEFRISGGTIAPSDFLQDGQYFRIVGSIFNDGVHQYPASDLTDEVFDGAVWAMAVPPAVIALAAEISDFNNSDAAKPAEFSSESFSGYSYTRAMASDGTALTWKDAYGKRLRQWRKTR